MLHDVPLTTIGCAFFLGRMWVGVALFCVCIDSQRNLFNLETCVTQRVENLQQRPEGSLICRGDLETRLRGLFQQLVEGGGELIARYPFAAEGKSTVRCDFEKHLSIVSLFGCEMLRVR